MPEIKIQDSFENELKKFAISGEDLRTHEVHCNGSLDLPVCKALCEAVRSLSGVAGLYKQLITKDFNELSDFVDKMKKLDNSL